MVRLVVFLSGKLRDKPKYPTRGFAHLNRLAYDNIRRKAPSCCAVLKEEKGEEREKNHRKSDKT